MWRDEHGRRVVRGRVWIGGCERTHTDVMIRERDERTLELWTLHSSARARVDELLAPIPPGATRWVDPGSRFEGDPSTGPIAP